VNSSTGEPAFWIVGVLLDTKIASLMGGRAFLARHGLTIYAGAVNRDHVHMLISIPPQLSAVQFLKGKSSHKLLSSTEKENYKGIQALRCLAAILVVIYHAMIYTTERLDPTFGICLQGRGESTYSSWLAVSSWWFRRAS
jgi:hypothetical protein